MNSKNYVFFIKKVLILLKHPVPQVASFDDNQLSHIGIIEGKVTYDCYMICMYSDHGKSMSLLLSSL